jgi:ferredoxin
MAIPVDEVEQVTAARCMSCLKCVAACPTTKQGALSWGPPRRLGGSWSQAVLITVMLLSVALAVTAACVYPIPSFVQSRGNAPAEIAAAELRIESLTCRGRGTLLWYYLTRDDIFAVEGYLKLEAWPAPGAADARVIYDPQVTAEQIIKDAIVEPYFDSDALTWRPSPFVIEGYDPLGLDDP